MLPYAIAIGLMARFPARPATAPGLAERIVANDNRAPAGALNRGVLTLRLVAREGRWFPQSDSGPNIVMQAFAEEDHPLQVPGPLIRVPAGTRVRLTVRNTLRSTLVLFGMHEHPGAADETLRIPAGAVRELNFRAGAPGTYFYWASTTGNGIRDRDGIDSQLYGGFVVDSTRAAGPPRDRVFIMGVLHESSPPSAMVINGKSWPFTERLNYQVGDTVRWRWINPSNQPHPMHLHGFYFTVGSRGAWAADTVYAPQDRRLAVTEMMMPGGTMTMTWIPARAGDWLFHCHFGLHVSHYLSLTDLPPEKEPDSQAEVDHTAMGMAGLVLGISVHDRPGAAVTLAGRGGRPKATQNIRLFMQASPAITPPGSGVVLHRYAFVAQRGETPPAPDSVPARSSPLVLRRGEPVRITIENRMPYPGAVHWHGIEVQNSYVDGVPGWSGSPGHLAPMIMPGDSFVVGFTPPRAGTFIYHSHSNDYFQIQAGLAAPLIVLDPGEPYDTLTDRTFLINQDLLAPGGRINGAATLDTLRFTTGTRYRLRFIDISPDWRVFVTLTDATGSVRWRALAKDGADLPPHQQTQQRALFPMAPGETADFAYTPDTPGNLVLDVTTQVPGWSIRVPIRVSANEHR